MDMNNIFIQTICSPAYVVNLVGRRCFLDRSIGWSLDRSTTIMLRVILQTHKAEPYAGLSDSPNSLQLLVIR